MISLSQERTRRLVAVHGWSAVLSGLFLYVVILTGAIAVLAHEIGEWSAGGAVAADPLLGDLDPLIRQLSNQVPASYLEDISLFANAAGQVVAFFHTHKENPASGMIEDYGSLFVLDPTSGKTVERFEGFASEVFNANPLNALEAFIVDLHVNLLAPEPWGLYATGILGFVLLVAAISGLLMHRHLIRDAFLTPRRSNAVLKEKDRHVLAGTWALLFSLVLGFTGAFFSFAGALGLPLVAVTAFAGDQIAMFETLLGIPEADDPRPAPLADLDRMIATSREKAGTTPTFITIAHWGRADARLQFFLPAKTGDLTADTHVYAGATGEFVGEQPALGTAPSAGATAFALMSPLHFGNFAGLLSKIIWVSLGLAACYVTASGLQLWLKRREDSAIWQRLGRAVDTAVYGTPLALAVAAHGFFVTLPRGTAGSATASAFAAASLICILLGICLPRARVASALRLLLGASLVLLPVTRVAAGSEGWITALENGHPLVMSMDLLMLGTGVFYLREFRSWRLTQHLPLPRARKAL